MAPPKRRRAIPPALHAATLARLASKNDATGKPYTTREVAAWLLEAHEVKCSHMAVVKLHAEHDKRGEALIIQALREELRDAVAPAKARLLRASKRLDVLVRTSKDPKAVAAAVNATTRALHELAHLSGVAAPITVDLNTHVTVTDARARLTEGLTKLAAEPGAGGAGGPGREPRPVDG